MSAAVGDGEKIPIPPVRKYQRRSSASAALSTAETGDRVGELDLGDCSTGTGSGELVCECIVG